MSIRELQQRTSNGPWRAPDFHAALRWLIEERIVWHENGMVKLLDPDRGLSPRNKTRYDFPNTSDLPPVGATLTEEW